MGYRTLVMFNNDHVDKVKDIVGFAEKLYYTILEGTHPHSDHGLRNICWVVEQDHADAQKLSYIDGFSAKTLAVRNWYPDAKDGEQELRLLRDAAEKLGYRLVRKSK